MSTSTMTTTAPVTKSTTTTTATTTPTTPAPAVIPTEKMIKLSEIEAIRNRYCRIVGSGITKEKFSVYGTGFLVSYEDCQFILTASHIFEGQEKKIDEYVAEFPDNPVTTLKVKAIANSPSTKEEAVKQGLDPDTTELLDLCVLTFSDSTLSNRSSFNLTDIKEKIISSVMTIIQYPQGSASLHQSFGEIKGKSGDILNYLVTTNGGSSGSLVLDDTFTPIAVHQSASRMKMQNTGLLIWKATEWIKENIATIKKEKKNTFKPEFQVNAEEKHVPGSITLKVDVIREFERSVCQIISSSKIGTGFLARYGGKDFIMTSHCILPKKPTIEPSTAHFSYENLEIELKEPFLTDKDLNISLVDFTRQSKFVIKAPIEEEKSRELGPHWVPFKLDGKEPLKLEENKAVLIYQHPRGHSSDLTTYCSVGSITKSDPSHLSYNIPTCEGSEGSIILNTEWKPAALHCDKNKGIRLDSEKVRLKLEEFINMLVIPNIDDLDVADRILIGTLKEKGKTVKEISNRLGHSIDLVQAFLDSEETENKNSKILDQDDKDIIKRLFQNDKPVDTIAKKLDKDVEVIENCINEMKSEKSYHDLDEDDINIIKTLAKKGKTSKLIAKKLKKWFYVDIIETIMKEP